MMRFWLPTPTQCRTSHEMQRTVGWPTTVLRIRCMSFLALREATHLSIDCGASDACKACVLRAMQTPLAEGVFLAIRSGFIRTPGTAVSEFGLEQTCVSI